MNADMLRKGVKSKKEIEAVAKELGYSSALEAANDLRELGLLSSTSKTPITTVRVASDPELLSSKEVLAIYRKLTKVSQRLNKLPYLIDKLRNQKITCKQFSFLMKGLEWEIDEEELFDNVIENITDLENFKTIKWHYNNTEKDFLAKYNDLYPEISGNKSLKKPVSETQRPRPISPPRGGSIYGSTFAIDVFILLAVAGFFIAAALILPSL